MFASEADHALLGHHERRGNVGRILTCALRASGNSECLVFQVKDLASVSLKQPVRIFVNSNRDVAPYLRQEFIRIRPSREGEREAIVAGTVFILNSLVRVMKEMEWLLILSHMSPALLTRTFQDHVMVFTQTKKQAHRMHIVFGLMGLKVGELHGNLSQAQRLESLRCFCHVILLDLFCYPHLNNKCDLSH